MAKINRLYWDIEIVPNMGTFWESGWRCRVPWTNITKERQIVCIAAQWEHGKRIMSWDWGDDMDDGDLLRSFAEVANTADELVAHNGDRYDKRMFAGRCLKHGILLDPNIKQFDTFQVAKRRFKLNSYSLAYIAHYCGIKATKSDMEYEDWIRVLEGNKTALRKMVKYCKQDIVVLREVYDKIAPYHNPKTHIGVLNRLDRWTCPHCASDRVHQSKRRPSAAGIVRYQFQCQSCGSYYSLSETVRKQYIADNYA